MSKYNKNDIVIYRDTKRNYIIGKIVHSYRNEDGYNIKGLLTNKLFYGCKEENIIVCQINDLFKVLYE